LCEVEEKGGERGEMDEQCGESGSSASNYNVGHGRGDVKENTGEESGGEKFGNEEASEDAC